MTDWPPLTGNFNNVLLSGVMPALGSETGLGIGRGLAALVLVLVLYTFGLASNTVVLSRRCVT